MSTWWGLIAKELGADYPPTGSAEQRVAYKLGAYGSPGNSWEAKIANKVGMSLTSGSWAGMIVGRNAVFGSTGRQLYYQLLSGTSASGGGGLGSLVFSGDAIIAEDVVAGSTLGTLSIIGGDGSATYAFDATAAGSGNPGNYFAIIGDELLLASPINHSTTPTIALVIKANNGAKLNLTITVSTAAYIDYFGPHYFGPRYFGQHYYG